MEAAIPIERLAELQRRIEQISRRYVRAGGSALRLVHTGRRVGPLAVVRLDGKTRELGKWDIVCVLHHQDGSTLARPCVPMDERQLARLVGTRALCEGCRTVRPRKQTFVVRERTTGRTMQLGSSCLRPYIGAEDPEAAIRRAQVRADIHVTLTSAARESPGPREEYIDTSAFLAHAVAVARSHGFRPAREPNSTWQAALNLLEEGVEPSSADLRRVREIRQWTAGLKPDQPSGYRARLVACLTRDRLTSRELALAASGVRAYNRHLYWEIRRERAAGARGSGQPGAGARRR